MAKYFIQNANMDARTFRFYGVQTEHNHTSANKFTKALKAIMKGSFPTATIRVGDFQSSQSAIPTGADVVQLRWKSDDWTNS